MYDVDYFIEKFEKIPEDKWCVGRFDDGYGAKCALGHCGAYEGMHHDTPELTAIHALVGNWKGGGGLTIVDINDGYLYAMRPKLSAATPRERVLNALRLIKENRKD